MLQKWHLSHETLIFFKYSHVSPEISKNFAAKTKLLSFILTKHKTSLQ